jgi:hypothetical protein
MGYDPILARSDSIIYQPGGVASGITVTNWAQVQEFIALRTGACTVIVDDSIVSPAPVPAVSGTTECFGRVQFQPWRIDSINYTVLEIEDGATLSNVFGWENMEVRCGSQSVPSLTFSGTPNGGYLILYDALLTQATTATQPAIVIPPGKSLGILMDTATGIVGAGFTAITVPLVSIGAGSSLAIGCFNNSYLYNNYASGGATSNIFLAIDDSSLWVTNPIGQANFPTVPAFTGTYTKDLSATLPTNVTMSFTASALNVLATLQADGLLPMTGDVTIEAEGYGSTGGGAGGTAGGAAPGIAGGGSGGALLQRSRFVHNLADPLTVGIGLGGTGGAGGIAPNGAGSDGAASNPSTCQDATTLVNLVSFAGSQQGSATGHGGASYAGAFIPTSSDLVSGYGAGFVAAGGKGGIAATDGTDGQDNLTQQLVPGATGRYLPGTGGTTAAGQGGGGGGGGAGVQAPGGLGGNGQPSGTPGGNGSGVAPNSGAGAGGGAGGAGAGDNGGDGGTGSDGLMGLKLLTIIGQG